MQPALFALFLFTLVRAGFAETEVRAPFTDMGEAYRHGRPVEARRLAVVYLAETKAQLEGFRYDASGRSSAIPNALNLIQFASAGEAQLKPRLRSPSVLASAGRLLFEINDVDTKASAGPATLETKLSHAYAAQFMGECVGIWVEAAGPLRSLRRLNNAIMERFREDLRQHNETRNRK